MVLCSVWESHTSLDGSSRDVPGNLNTESLGAPVVVCSHIEFPGFLLYINNIVLKYSCIFDKKIVHICFISTLPLSMLDTLRW